MPDCLVTLNLGDHLCDNARNSFLAACNRWQCSFFEITENLVGDQDLCFNKIAGIKKYVQEHDVNWMIYLDSDILIRDDAPNPFSYLHDTTKVHATRDAYDHWNAHRLAEHRIGVTDHWLRVAHDLLRWNVDIDGMIRTSPEWFFNAGVFMLQPKKLKEEINAFLEGIPPYRVEGRVEQAMWNYILKARKKLAIIDQTWDYISPDISSGCMEKYIYHFTGDNQPLLRTALPTFSWTKPAQIQTVEITPCS